MTAPARPNHVFHGLKKPEIAYLPTACAEASPFRRQPCFRAAVPIWDGNRGDSRGKSPNPHTFLCIALLQLDFCAGLFELSLDLLGLVLVHAFLDRLGRALDEVLGFLEAQTGDGADFLDDFDLL